MINPEVLPKGPNVFALRLRQLRQDRQLTQNEMARQMNLPRVTYTHYELGKRTPDLDIIIQLARFHQVSVDYLVGNSTFRPTLDAWLRQDRPAAETGLPNHHYNILSPESDRMIADQPPDTREKQQDKR